MSDSTLQEARDKAAAYEYPQAVALYKQYLEENGSVAEIWAELGTIYKEMDNIAESAEAFGEAFDCEPDNPRFVYLFGKSQEKMHRFADARALYEKAYTLSGGLKARIKSGDMLVKLGKNDEALAFFTDLSKQYPDNAAIMHRIGLVFATQNNIEKANIYFDMEVVCRRRTLETKETARNWYLLADTLAYMNRWEEAETAFRRSLEIENIGNTSLRLGSILIQQGKIVEGKGFISQYAEKNGRNLRAVLQIGDIMTKFSQYDDAITYYTKALEIRNVRADTWTAIAYALLMKGQKQEAKAFFEMAKASAAIRELPWADKMHKSEKTEILDRELGE